MEVYKFVAGRIRELRKEYGNGTGISQTALSKALGLASNAVSRWESQRYKPDLEDLERVAVFFGITIHDLLPQKDLKSNSRLSKLNNLLKSMPENEIEEVGMYAEFRRSKIRLGERKAKARIK